MKFRKPLFYASLLLLLSTDISAKVYKVATEAAFIAATEKVVPGDEIIILNGQYAPWQLVINTKGEKGKLILIHAETPGKVIFSGDVNKPVFLLTGTYTEIAGINFSNCNQVKNQDGNGVLIELKTTYNCRVTGCSFIKNSTKVQFTPMLVISGKGEMNRVDHCNFMGNIDNQEVQVKITKDEVPVQTLIDHNEFKDKNKVSWSNGNGGECIQIGQDPILLGTLYSYATIRDNTFKACNGEPEVISNKSSGNIYINNNFENCQGELVMRGGHDCKIDSNTIRSGSGGIRINGTKHIITNNTLIGLPTGIRLMYGMSKGQTDIGFYVAASDCTIKNNRISNCKTGILIGDSKNADWTGKFDVKRYPSRTMQDIAPFNNSLTDNKITDTQTPILHNENP
jgi:poly(beta-D-mannuronate) lyase